MEVRLEEATIEVTPDQFVGWVEEGQGLSALRAGPARRGWMACLHVDPMVLRVQLHALNIPRCDNPKPVTMVLGVLKHPLSRA